MTPRRSGALPGRDAELAAIDEVSGRAVLLLVQGQPGMGKTTLLREVHRIWHTRGHGVVRIHGSAAIPQWDLYGARAVVKAFRHSFPEFGDSLSAGALAAVNRLCRPESYGSARARSALFAELVKLFAHISGRAPGAVLIDDAHAVPDPSFIVAAAHRAGCTVVATCVEYRRAAGPAGSALPHTAADRVVSLGPLPDQRIDALLADAAGEPLDEAVAPALRAALGPWAGNPGTVLDVFETLREDGHLVRFQGLLCLSTATTGPALPSDHALVRRVAECGDIGRRLLALTASAGRLALDDLPGFAAATGHGLAACGQTVDRLVAAGALACDDQGVLRAPCPALVTALRTGTLRDEAAEVHRALAVHLLRGGDRTPPPDPTAVADALARAGTALPATPSVAPLLEHEATGSLRTRPEKAARWYRAALYHCAPGDPAHSRILTVLLPLLVRTGDYEVLAEAVAEGVRAAEGRVPRAELAAYAALAAVHTGRPVPVPVYEALADDPAAGDALEFAARWFTGRAPLRASEVMTAFACLTGHHPENDPPDGDGDRFDPVGLFRQALGTTGYGAPVTGPLTAYARIMRNYLSGNWTSIPSEARALHLSGGPDTPVNHAVRLIAAEVHSFLGDFDRSAAWLEPAGDDGPFPALRVWVSVGLACRTGDWVRARELGWATCEAAAEEKGAVGIGRLFVRLAFAEWQDDGRRKLLPSLHTEARRWYERLGGTKLRAATLITGALAERDVGRAHLALDILREHGGRSELMLACMTVASLADDPRPWRREAQEIVRSLRGGDRRAMATEPVWTPGVPLLRDPAGLSVPERRMTALVGRGLSNRQIARELRVSEKTVENNLTQVFAKTGCRSRLDLALAVLEGRLAAPLPRS